MFQVDLFLQWTSMLKDSLSTTCSSMIDHSCVHVLTCRVLHARGKCAYMCQNTFCQAFGAFSSSICVEDCLAVFQGWAVWCVLGSIWCDMLDLLWYVCCHWNRIWRSMSRGIWRFKRYHLQWTYLNQNWLRTMNPAGSRRTYAPHVVHSQDRVACGAWYTQIHTPRHVSTFTYLM